MPRSFQRPPGVLSRLTPDWFARSGAAGCATANPGAGQFGVVSLFNNDTAGRPIYVYGVYVITFGAAACDMQIFHGPFGTFNYAGGALYSGFGTGSISGNTYVGNSVTTQIGYDIGEIGVRNGAMYWPYSWPCAILAGGDSLLVVGLNPAVSFLAGFWWFIDDDLK